ncbi:uncharacterized protein LOC114828337 [Galendromus occidentalis]|uniref:Uncharacterized protein LOC114828337 n=1 Tax=Galendromus occidentalis TaxID=34638 RepID=A0AAJ7SH01_9ACAR|nr:uncharacterized protein LOC114828337 [Galendromus occidentalis]
MPHFHRVRDLFEESKCCEFVIEDTLPDLITWSSSSDDFINDQAVLVVTPEQLALMSKKMTAEIESWPSKYGAKFMTLMVVLESGKSIHKNVEDIIILHQLDSLFNVRSVHNPLEIYQLLYCMTKATAEKHSKILRQEVLGFEGGKRTASSGRDAWVAFLEMFFTHAANPLAKAVAEKYPSVSALRRELLRKPVAEVFEDIRVTVGQPPLQRTFRIGAESANKIYNFFTQDDPEFLV